MLHFIGMMIMFWGIMWIVKDIRKWAEKQVVSLQPRTVKHVCIHCQEELDKAEPVR